MTEKTPEEAKTSDIICPDCANIFKVERSEEESWEAQLSCPRCGFQTSAWQFDLAYNPDDEEDE